MKYRNYRVWMNVKSTSVKSMKSVLEKINSNNEKIVHVILVGEDKVEIITLGQDN